MKDSILKGTGNSRFLKSAIPEGTSWADALAMLQVGTFPIDFNGINTEGFQQVGTPLNKANLLKDATAAQIGLPSSTTPDGMFQALGNTGELHVWRKTVAISTGTYSLGAVQEGLHYIKWANYATSDSSVGTFEYGSEVSVNNDGTITGIKNPSTITIEPWYDDASKANVFKGKFIKMISQVETSMSSFNIGEIWWIPADAMMTTGLVNGEGNTRYIAASKRQQVIGVPAETTTTYPVSTNPNAYQEGSNASTTIEYLGKLGDKARVQVVSYVGTGTNSSKTPNSLSFDFVPRIVFILCWIKTNSNFCQGMLSPLLGHGFCMTSGYSGYGDCAYLTVKSSGNKITWTGKDPYYQLNESGAKYYAVAIG